MPQVKLIQVGLIRDRSDGKEAPGSITRPADALPWLTDILAKDRECFAAIHLDSRNRPIAVEVVSIGTLNASMVHPRELFKAAILSNDAGLVLAHNHPSGDPTPSREDMELTRRMVQAGDILGIEVLDHIVVAPDGGFVSMGEANLMGKP